MRRTQVYLDEEELELLARTSGAVGASRSELIRRAVRQVYGSSSTVDRKRALAASAGSWRDRSFSGAEYVDGVRGDLNERLHRLGLR